MKKIKDVPRFLLDNGLLFEINRRVLHPLGLALEIEVDDSSGRPRIKFGDIWDCRDDPEGVLYSEESFQIGFEKYQKFMDQYGNERLQTRQERLGFVEQSGDKDA